MSKDILNRLAQGYERKTALSPLCWIIGILTVGLINVIVLSGNVLYVALLASLDIAAVIFFFVMYWHFAKTDADRLHSEKFILQKITLEAEKNKKPIITDGNGDIMETEYKEVAQ